MLYHHATLHGDRLQPDLARLTSGMTICQFKAEFWLSQTVVVNRCQQSNTVSQLYTMTLSKHIKKKLYISHIFYHLFITTVHGLDGNQ